MFVPHSLEARKPRSRDVYLVEPSIAAVKHHLEGNVGAVLNTRDSRRGGQNADASGSARSLEIADDELISTGRGVKIVEGSRGSRGREHHPD